MILNSSDNTAKSMIEPPVFERSFSTLPCLSSGSKRIDDFAGLINVSSLFTQKVSNSLTHCLLIDRPQVNDIHAAGLLVAPS